MEHHETPSRRPRDASLARASLSPSRAAVIKSTHHSSKNQQARPSASQLVNTVYPYDWRVRTFGYRPSVPGNPSNPIDRIDRTRLIDRTRSIDRRHRSMGCRMGMCFRQFYHCLILYNIDIICISQLIKSYFGLRCSHARSMARAGACLGASPGGARRHHATGRPRGETSSSWCELRTRTRERDVSTAGDASGDVASDDDEDETRDDG